MDIYVDEIDEVAHVHFGPEHRVKLHVVLRDGDIRFIENTHVDMPGLIIFVDPPVVEHKVLKNEQNKERPQIFTTVVPFQSWLC